MTEGADSYLTPEARARVEIDRMLAEAGWIVQDEAKVNLAAGRGIAVREFVLQPPHGRVDYLMFVDCEAAGVIEAKPEGATLTGVEWQSARYLDGLPDWVDGALEGPLPFAYQSTGTETRFTNTLDPKRGVAKCSGSTDRRRLPLGSAKPERVRLLRRFATA